MRGSPTRDRRRLRWFKYLIGGAVAGVLGAVLLLSALPTVLAAPVSVAVGAWVAMWIHVKQRR